MYRSVLIMCFCLCDGDDIFHVKSKMTFRPDSVSEYFGYTVVLGANNSLLVGAPKASSRLREGSSPGLVFTCKVTSLNVVNVTCYPLGMDDDGRDKSVRRIVTVKDFFRDDMWFGATIATVPDGKLLVCAPRWADPYKDKHLLANGACYIETTRRGMTLTPLKDQYRLAFKTDGARREYGEYGTHLNFYAYGQAGMSVKVTENNSIIIGAPGLMQWTGGVIDYRYSPDPNSVFFNKQPITNPYFTKDLGPDDYFGYSVESGIFQVNGTTLYVAGAPRSKMGYGQVLIFEPAVQESDPLNIKAKVRGPQLGAYFGASLCCSDINGDGRSDLLVGAPNFVKSDGGLPFDQGAVFVFLAKEQDRGFILEKAGYLTGSGESGARFGSVIADLGDIDGDGFRDIAVGAPWESEGLGAVYIYKGTSKGLNNKYVQRVVSEDARGLGISISKGVDIDGNHCNDLAIGAHGSSTAYVYRCVPTVEVHAVIKIPDAMNLPQDASNFTAQFCIKAAVSKAWPHVKLDLHANITVDPGDDRAYISGDSEYNVSVRPGNEACDEQVIEVKPTADLTKPITILFGLTPKDQITNSSTLVNHAARLSENSTLNASFVIQLVRDCGDDLICTPWLVMTVDPFNSQYIPGTDEKIGAKVTVLNKEEPAYGANVKLRLPLLPKRVPVSCSLEGFNMTCEIPGPLGRGSQVEWEIELEPIKFTDNKELAIEALLEDALFRKNITDTPYVKVVIDVVPMANFSVGGKALPNITIPVSREKFYEGGLVSLVHYYDITNDGPSDWSQLEVKIKLDDNVTLTNLMEFCVHEADVINCNWSIPAKVSLPVVLPLKFNLSKHGLLLEEHVTYNVTSTLELMLEDHSINSMIISTLSLTPSPPIWPLIVGFLAGIMLLSTIVFGLYKYGFFSRTSRDELQRLQAQEQGSSPESNDEPCGSIREPSIDADESTLELLSDDSD